MDIDVKSLHPLEIKVLLHVQSGETLTSEKIQTEPASPSSHVP